MITLKDAKDSQGTARIVTQKNGALLIDIGGSWKIGGKVPDAEEIVRQIESLSGVSLISFDRKDLHAWDSSLPIFIFTMQNLLGGRGIRTDTSGLPEGVARLISIASETRQRQDLLEYQKHLNFVGSIGKGTLSMGLFISDVFRFIGDSALAFTSFMLGRARYRGPDMRLLLYQCGVQALPIVSLISILVGLIFGFVGAVELRVFGAQIYIADLVAVSMTREMGAMMTAIIMTGRTGAAYATQLGTMETNEETDALTTLGISPAEFLVMPRIVALVLMMPLLCVYADLMGILGGMFVGVGMFGMPAAQYYDETVASLSITYVSLGIIKSGVFAYMIAIFGCFYGLRSSRRASAVGYAATKAVVAGIVMIVVTDGVFAVITTILNI